MAHPRTKRERVLAERKRYEQIKPFGWYPVFRNRYVSAKNWTQDNGEMRPVLAAYVSELGSSDKKQFLKKRCTRKMRHYTGDLPPKGNAKSKITEYWYDLF